MSRSQYFPNLFKLVAWWANRPILIALESGVKQEASDSGRITKYDKHISRQPQPKSSLSSSTKRSLKVFLENNNPCKAIWCYYKMLVANARPNKCTYPTLFKACSAAECFSYLHNSPKILAWTCSSPEMMVACTVRRDNLSTIDSRE
jgi:hypothetical protein